MRPGSPYLRLCSAPSRVPTGATATTCEDLMAIPTNATGRIADAFISELEMEMPPTRRLLERVPSEKGAWKPHPKSFSLGHLAQLVARMPGWTAMTLRHTALDLGSAPPYSQERTETLLAEFDRCVKDAREPRRPRSRPRRRAGAARRLPNAAMRTSPRPPRRRAHSSSPAPPNAPRFWIKG